MNATISAIPQTGTPSCPFCNRAGLPILPVRYAVARADKGSAPDIAKPFDAGPVSLPKDSAKYSLRLLRPGFLYMFDEVRGEWTAYVVTEQGYLYQFDYLANVAPHVPNKTFDEACRKKNDPYIARCVFVKNAEKAGNIWLGFSDAIWTDEVRKNHEKKDHREKHMRRIDMASVRKHAPTKGKVTHFGPLEKIERVADFTRKLQPPAKASVHGKANPRTPEAFAAMEFSEQPVFALAEEAQGLINWTLCTPTPYQPIMAALSDPVGVAGDIGMLMLKRADEFAHDESTDKDRARKVALSAAIANLKEGIETQAQQTLTAQNDVEATNAEVGYEAIAPNGVTYWVDGDAKMAAVIRAQLNPVTLQAAADDAWKKYRAMYYESKHDNPKNNREDWKNSFDTAFNEFDNKITGPLAVAHRDVMKSAQAANYFQCNFCTKSAVSGAMYAAVLGNSIKGTQDKHACNELYTWWLEGRAEDRENLLLRALNLNNDYLASQIQAAAQSSVTYAQLSWDKLMAIGKSVLDQLTQGEQATMARLTVMVSGAVTGAIKTAAASRTIFSGLVTIGVLAQTPFVEVVVTGSKKRFRELLIRRMLQLNEQSRSVPENRLRQVVSNELRRLEATGVDLKGGSKKTWLLMLDPAHVKGMPKGLSAEGQAKWIVASIRTPEQVQALEMAPYQDMLKRGGDRVKGAMPSGSFALAVCALLANGWAMNSILDDDESSLDIHKDEMRRRVYAQGVWVVGATADAIEVGLTRLAAGGMRLGVAGEWLRLGAEWTGRALGVVGGVLMAIWDGMRAYEEWKAGHLGGMVAYGVSAVLGLAATVLLFFGMTGIGLVVVGLMFLWAFVVMYLVNDKIQDWLEQCYWGRGTVGIFPNSAKELEQLKVAVGA